MRNPSPRACTRGHWLASHRASADGMSDQGGGRTWRGGEAGIRGRCAAQDLVHDQTGLRGGRVGGGCPPLPLEPAPPALLALHRHLSSFRSFVFIHSTAGQLPPPHIQGGIITLQTKHVLLAWQDGLSGEISCRLLCSHRGSGFL